MELLIELAQVPFFVPHGANDGIFGLRCHVFAPCFGWVVGEHKPIISDGG
jgi:hypothetical protein